MLEQLTIGAIVLGAAFFIARRVWQTIAAARAPKTAAACDSGCGCGPAVESPRENAAARR
jgi:hypothetical protein